MRGRDETLLNFRPSSLSREYCDTCREETLHVRGFCNHCAEEAKRTATGVPGRKPARQRESQSPWRAQHDATAKALMRAGKTEKGGAE